MKEIIIATSNLHKMNEFKNILPEFNLYSLKDINWDLEIIENGKTFEENAIIKSRTVCNKIGKTVIADDSGLEIYALNNEPGIYSARYLGSDTPYEEKNKIILERMKNICKEDRGARFVCCISISYVDGRDFVFKGVFEGEISEISRGKNGFGYDPIFFVKEYGMTSAELDPKVKNMISHRGKAMKKLIEHLEEEKYVSKNRD